MKKLLLLLLITFFVVIVPFAYVSNAYHAYLLERQITYLKAISSISCKENSPRFLKKILLKRIYMDSVSNQIIFKNGNEIFWCVSGWKDQNHKIRLKISDNYKIASLSKLYTSSLIVDLLNKRKIKLEDKITKFFPMTQPKDKEVLNIKIIDLLRHSAGFDRGVSGDRIFSDQEWCGKNLVSSLNEVILDYKPGSKMVYSNEGYCILGVILERYYNESLHEIILKKHKNVDLKMLRIENYNSEVYYNYKYSPVDAQFYRNIPLGNLKGSADIVTNAEAFLNSLEVMVEQKPLNILSMNYMLPCDVMAYKSCYGIGMSPLERNGSIFYTRDGVLPGVMTYSVVDSQKNILILFTNSMPYNIDKKNDGFKDFIISELHNFK